MSPTKGNSLHSDSELAVSTINPVNVTASLPFSPPLVQSRLLNLATLGINIQLHNHPSRFTLYLILYLLICPGLTVSQIFPYLWHNLVCTEEQPF